MTLDDLTLQYENSTPEANTKNSISAYDRLVSESEGSIYSSTPGSEDDSKLTLEQIAQRKQDRLSKKAIDLSNDDSNFMLKAKSAYNTVNDIWGGTDVTANYMGREHTMSNKVFENVNDTMEQSQIKKQELIDQYNTAEDDPNAKHKVYQLRLLDGYDSNGNPIYTYKTGIAETSAAERYKNQYIKNGYEILSEKGFAGAEDWENQWHGLKANIADRTFEEGYNSKGKAIKDISGIGAGYSEVYNTQNFDIGKSQEDIDANKLRSEELAQQASLRARGGYGRGSDSMVDAFQAGGLKTLADLGDTVLDVVTPGDNTWLNKAKDQSNIDKYVGYDRKTGDKAIGEATGYFKQGKYANALWEVLKEPQLVAESIPMMIEMALPLPTKVTKAGKLYDALKKADKAGDFAEQAKIAKQIATEVTDVQKGMYSLANNAGFLAAVSQQTNNQVEERVKNNQLAGATGGDSPMEVAGVFASNILNLGLDRLAFAKITGFGGAKSTLGDAFGMLDDAGKKSLINKIGKAAYGTTAAGATEGAQEYLQTWGEIINQELGTGVDGKTLSKIFSDPSNQDEAIGAMLAGAAGGSHMRSASNAIEGTYNKIINKDVMEKMKNERNEREKYSYTSGSNWFTRADSPSSATDRVITPQEYAQVQEDISFTRHDVKNNSSVNIANSIYSKKPLIDAKGNAVDPKTGLNNMLDTLRDTYFAELPIDTASANRYRAKAKESGDPAEEARVEDLIKTDREKNKKTGISGYTNDYMSSYKNIVKTLSSLDKNVSDDIRKSSIDNVTDEFISKIHSEPDVEIRDALLAKFTNEFVAEAAKQTIYKTDEASATKGKSTADNTYGSQAEVKNSVLYGEKHKEYIDSLKEVKKRIFGSQNPNEPKGEAEQEFDEKIRSFEQQYIKYQTRLEEMLASGKSEQDAITLLDAKTSEDVANEILDGAGFIVNIKKPSKKSINGHMQAIERSINNIKHTANESWNQSKNNSNNVDALLSDVDKLAKFSDSRSKNNDMYEDLMNTYREDMTYNEKKDFAEKLMNIESEFTNISNDVKKGAANVDAEVKEKRDLGIPVYRVGLDRIKPVEDKLADGTKVYNDVSTGSKMIKEGEIFIKSLNDTKDLIESKIKLKLEATEKEGVSKKVKDSILEDIQVMQSRIETINLAINMQQENIDRIKRYKNIVSDKAISKARSEIIEKLKAEKEANTPGSENKKTEEVKSEEVKTSENKTSDTKADIVQSEPDVDDSNYDTTDTDFIIDEEINTTENINGEQNESTNETTIETASNEQTGETESGTKTEAETARDSETENGNRDGQEESGVEETTNTGSIETTIESNIEDKRDQENIEQSTIAEPIAEKNTVEKTEKELRKEFFTKKDEELFVKVSGALKDGKSIIKITEKIIADEKSKKEEDRLAELAVADDEINSIYKGLEEELMLKEINKELKALNTEISDILNPEDAIEKLTTVKDKKALAIDKLLKVSKAIADKTSSLMIESANLTKGISKKESKLRELEIELSEAMNILSEDEKAIVRQVRDRAKINSEIAKNKNSGSEKIAKANKLKDEIKNIDEKIETLTAISSNKNIGKEKINSIKQKIRDLENIKKSIKYGKDSAITKSFKEYNDALNELDNAEDKQDIVEAEYKVKVANRRYKNELTVDKDIRNLVRKNLVEVLANETNEAFKVSIENAINALDGFYPGYQDLVNNSTKYSRTTFTGRIIDADLVRKSDMPNYIKAYIELDDNMKGQIKLKKANNIISRLSEGTTSEKIKSNKEELRAKTIENYFNIKGASYKARIDKEYPIGSEARQIFEDTLYADLNVITQTKMIYSKIVTQKPISAISSGSDETMQDVVNENLEPEKTDSNELKKLDNPTISIEQGKIVARDSNGDIIDTEKYSINIMALLFGKDEKGYTTIPGYAEEIIKIEVIKEISNMYKILATDANLDDGKHFDEIWGIDGTNKYAADLRQQVFDNYISKGMIPESVIVKSLGSKIYKALPMSFDKNTIERNTEDIISAQLGLYAIGALSNQKMEVEVTNEVTYEQEIIKSGITRYATQEDVDAENARENKAFKSVNIDKTMIAMVETAWVNKKENGIDIVDDSGNVLIESKISPLRLMKLPINSLGLSLKRISETLEYTDESSIGNVASFEPITEVSDNIKNKKTEKSEISKETILDYQSVEYKFTDNIKEMYNMWKNPSTRNIAYKFANILDPDEKKLTIKEYKSRLAKNRNSRLELDSLMRLYEEAGTERGFYLKWDMIASGRYMIDSSISPQANKITRFLIATDGTRTNIKFNDGKVSEKILGGIKRSIAQALDYGLDKDLDTYVIAKMEKDFVVNLDGSVEFKKTEKAKIIKRVYSYFSKSIANEDEQFDIPMIVQVALEKLNAEGEGFHAVQAIRELAKFNHEASISSGSENHEYSAHFVIEADGITSGMMITLAQIMSKDAINLFEKGGLYTKDAIAFWIKTSNVLGLADELKILGNSKDGNQKITHGLLNRIGKMLDPVALKKDKGISMEEAKAEVASNMQKLKDAGFSKEEIKRANFKDFYNTIANSVTENLKKIIQGLDYTIATSDKEYIIERAKLSKALISVVGDQISRAMAKDPVMVFIYGSSLGSIKNKILNGLIASSLQELISDKEFINKFNSNEDIATVLGALGFEFTENTVSVPVTTRIEQVVGESGNKSLEPVITEIQNGKKTIGLNMLRNIVIDGRMMKNLFFASFNTYGKAFEQGFDDNFNFINRYRDIIKAIEVVRFQVFDVKFENKVNELIKEKSYEDKDGVYIEYNPTNSELDEILKALTNEGFGHAIRDINGGYHSFEKTEKSEADRRTSLRTINKTENGQFVKGGDNSVSNAVGIKKHVVNVGAAPVTSIHNQDGWQIRYATMKNGIQNVFDAEITGLDNHSDGVYTYNEGFSIANTKHSILQSQLVDMEKVLNSLTADEKAQMFANFNEKQAMEIVSVYEKMRNIDDAVEAAKINGQEVSKDKAREAISSIDELRVSRNNLTSGAKDIVQSLSNTISVAINHLYAVDSTEQYVGTLGGFKDEKADIDMVFNTYYDIISNAMKVLYPTIDTSKSEYVDTKMKAKYAVENPLADNAKEQKAIKKEFEKLLSDKRIAESDKIEIRDILDKLINCKP